MNVLDYIIIVLYITGFLFLGRLFRENKSGQDYFLGGKSFGWFPLAMSTAATQLSAISFISAPAFVGLKQGGGMKWLTYEFAVPLAMLFLMIFLVPPMYKAGIVSVYGYLEKRFNASTRVLLSMVFQISRAFATGVMIYTVALILTSVLSVPMWQTILVIGVVTLIYSYQGGMKAVVYGDVIQMLILFVGIAVCLGFGLHYAGGWENVLANVDPSRLKVVDFRSMGIEEGDEFGFWPMVLGGFFLYVSYYGTDQSQVQRLFSASSIRTVKSTLLCNGLMRFPITLFYCLMGLVIGAFALSEPAFLSQIPDNQPDRMIPIFIRDYLPNGVIGLLIVAIFSAAMSSLSSAINSLSAASVEDFIHRRNPLSDQQYMRYSKYFALFWGVVSITLAFFVGDIAKTVSEAINKIGSVFFGPILATFISAIAIRKVHAIGANVGLLTGVLVNVLLWQFVPEVFWFWWNAIGAVVTISVGILASLLIPYDTKPGQMITFGKLEWEPRFGPILLGFFVLIVALSVFLPDILS